MIITHYRHATSIIEIDNKRILLDPVFAKKETYPPIIHTRNPKRNPLLDLPTNYCDLLNVDGIIITHNHNDHFDKLAKKFIPRDFPILCQEEDYEAFRNLGFLNLTNANKSCEWLDLECKSFNGYHGGHIFKKKLGYSSSFLIIGNKYKVYITGDTLLTRKVKKNIRVLSPNFIIANGGGARMNYLGKLTMNNKDILYLSKLFSKSKIIAVHMDSINHCSDTREKLKERIPPNIMNLYIPNDGEKLLL